METRRLTFTPEALALLVGIVAAVVWGGTPAFAASVTSTSVVPIAGIADGLPESVELSGRALIRTVQVTDPVEPPGVVVSITLLGVSGVGLSTGTRYAATSEHNLTRLFGPSDLIEVTFPFTPVGSRGLTSARSGLATFTLTFDINSGQLKGATAKLASPSFPN